ncbi:MAG: Hsp70 family protein [Phycisphaerales bacterium]
MATSDTIDYGIDLGTTNSVIARSIGGDIEVIKNKNAEITPSMVAYDKRGTEIVGAAAKNMFADPRKSPDVQAEFKRVMGQDVDLRFHGAGLTLSPEQLSKAVLAELRKAAAERYGDAPPSAVITVPAMFELPQNEATATSARLAGFQHSQLLQEPVAAAIAYGMEPSNDRSLWLVYDFGGGTFDTSLVAIRDGQLSVVKHAGDNYLGGADFDWAIVDEVLLPAIQKRYDIGSLRRHDKDDLQSLGRIRRLKSFAEEIKIELSSRDEVVFYKEGEDVFEDDQGDLVDLDVSIDREMFEQVIRESIDRSIKIARSAIHDSGYKPDDIEQVLMVGGTTFVPLVREAVKQLGIPLGLKLDPMTVVARGAAAFASTQVMPETAARSTQRPKPAGSASIKLEYERVTKSLTPPVGGRVELANEGDVSSCTVSITRDDEGFSSGALSPDPSGIFFTEVQIRDKGQSSFHVELRDASGTSIPVEPSAFSITNGLSVGKATLPSGFAVALEDGSAVLLAKSGSTLPLDIAPASRRSTKNLQAGGSDDLVISFLSGDDPRADHNMVSSRIQIRGTDIKRDLPRGTELEITAHIDASGVAHPRVYIERLDEEFEPAANKDRKTFLEHEPAVAMRDRLTAARARIRQLQEQAQDVSTDAATQDQLSALSSNERLQSIEKHIDAWDEGDNAAAGKARNELTQLSRDISTVATLIEWPAKLEEFAEIEENLDELLREVNQPGLREAADKLLSEGRRAIDSKDADALDKCIANLESLRFALLRELPDFWIGMLQHMSQREHEFSDRAAARELFMEGMQAAKRRDTAALRSVCQQLWSDLPQEAVEEVRRSAIRSDVH